MSTDKKRVDPDIAAAQRELADWARKAESYIKSDPAAKQVVVQFTGGKHPDLSDLHTETKLDYATITLIIERLRELGLVASLGDGKYGALMGGSIFIDNRAGRWKRELEEDPIREELRPLTDDELTRRFLAVTLKLRLETKTKAEARHLEVVARVIRKVQEEREKDVKQAG